METNYILDCLFPVMILLRRFFFISLFFFLFLLLCFSSYPLRRLVCMFRFSSGDELTSQTRSVIIVIEALVEAMVPNRHRAHVAAAKFRLLVCRHNLELLAYRNLAYVHAISYPAIADHSSRRDNF